LNFSSSITAQKSNRQHIYFSNLRKQISSILIADIEELRAKGCIISLACSVHPNSEANVAINISHSLSFKECPLALSPVSSEFCLGIHIDIHSLLGYDYSLKLTISVWPVTFYYELLSVQI
jgi:hypothetical protein